MKTNKYSIIILTGVLLIILSFFLHNDFNKMLKDNFDILFYNWVGFLTVYSLTIIPLLLILLYFKKFYLAFWLSFLILLFQPFSDGFLWFTSMRFFEYLIHFAGISASVIAYHRFVKTKFKNNIIIFVLAIFYVLFLLLFSISSPNLDNNYSILLLAIVGYAIFISVKYYDFKAVQKFIIAYYILVFILLTFNMRCNIEYISDIGFVNWNINNLLNRCDSFYCWGIGAIMINYAMVLKIKSMT